MMPWGGEFAFDDEVLAKRVESLAFKLTTVVGDDCLGYLEPTYDVFPHEVMDLCFCDCGQSLYFYPFREVINCHKQEFHLFLM